MRLGFGSAPAANDGSYVTLGTGESVARYLAFGLTPAPAAQAGSYITLGEGQSASKFAMFGLSPGAAAGVTQGSAWMVVPRRSRRKSRKRQLEEQAELEALAILLHLPF